jgi:hypothetical protein
LLLDVTEHLRNEEQRVVPRIGRDECGDEHDGVDDDDRGECGDVPHTCGLSGQVSPQKRSVRSAAQNVRS